MKGRLPRFVLPMISSQWRFTFSRNEVLHPGRVIDSVQILIAEIRGYGDYGVPACELRSQLLDSGQDRSGAASDEQMIIPNESPTGFDRLFFCYCYNSVRFGEIRQLRSHTRPNAGDVSFAGRAPESNRAFRLDGYDLDPRELMMQPFGDSAEGSCGACSHKNPIDFVELARDLIRRLLGMNILVGYVG